MQKLKSLEEIRKKELLGYWYQCILAIVLLLMAEASLITTIGSLDWLLPPVCLGRVFSALLLITSPFVALVVYFAKNNLHFRQLAMLDELTGLGSLRYLRQEVPRLLATARRRQAGEGQGEPLQLHVFYADMDGLKRINDAPGLGHPAGDVAIKGVAEAFRRTFKREDDVTARIGGDEFVAAFVGPAMPSKKTEKLGAKFYAHLRQIDREIEEKQGLVLDLAATLGCYSASISEQEVFESLLKLADADMYERKRARKLAAERR